MPVGVNLPKAALALAVAGAGLVGAGFGLFLVLFGLSGSPDYSFEAEQLVWVLAPVGMAAFCGWLLRRHADRIGRAGRDRNASLVALVWLGNAGVALALALYLLAESFPWVTSAGAYALALGCAWAITRSLRGLFAFAVTAVLAVALDVSQALDTWLGVNGL
jgi:hypothetical protein